MMAKNKVKDLAETLAASWLAGNVNVVLKQIDGAESNKVAASLALEIHNVLLKGNRVDDATAFRYAMYNRAIT